MPLLQVRDCPEELYNKLSRQAKRQNRSISQETIAILKTALNVKNDRKERLSRLFQELDAIIPETPESLPDPTQMIREDRDR